MNVPHTTPLITKGTCICSKCSLSPQIRQGQISIRPLSPGSTKGSQRVEIDRLNDQYPPKQIVTVERKFTNHPPPFNSLYQVGHLSITGDLRIIVLLSQTVGGLSLTPSQAKEEAPPPPSLRTTSPSSPVNQTRNI